MMLTLTLIALMVAPLARCDLQEARKSFDYLAFAQIWPITSCDIWEAKGTANKCNLPQQLNGRWTIHGVWPSATKGPHPFNCNKTLPFNETSLDPIMSQLQLQWTDVHKNSPKDDFWKHEWTKHGTCAIELEPLNTELKYFSKALELNNKYEIGAILYKAGIIPGKPYTGNQLVNAVSQSIGKRAGLECVKDSNSDTESKFLVSQVMICFSKNLDLIDCDEKSFMVGCNADQATNFYPLTPHQRNIFGTPSASMIVGIVAVICIMIIAGVCLFVCYRKNMNRYRGYDSI